MFQEGFGERNPERGTHFENDFDLTFKPELCFKCGSGSKYPITT